SSGVQQGDNGDTQRAADRGRHGGAPGGTATADNRRRDGTGDPALRRDGGSGRMASVKINGPRGTTPPASRPRSASEAGCAQETGKTGHGGRWAGEPEIISYGKQNPCQSAVEM